MQRRPRIVVWSIIGGLLVLGGIGVFFELKHLVPAWCFIPTIACEGLGIWLLFYVINRNRHLKESGSSKRSFIPFGIALFLIIFGIGIALTAFNLIPSEAWGAAAFLIGLGAMFIYRALILSDNGDTKGRK